MSHLVQIAVVPPRNGMHDQVEMFAIDDQGRLWHRLSDLRGGWEPWQLDRCP